jgi:5'-3' exonuclease
MLCGDKSDNISGIKNMGIKRLLTLVPEIQDRKVTLNEVIKRGNNLLLENKDNWLVKNLLTGVTKHGVFGDEFFEINEKIVNLSKPILTEDAVENIESLIHDEMDPEGRSYKNTMKMMMEDGLFHLLPKSDDAWVKFFNPFLRLTRKEKNKRTIKVKRYE